LFGKNIVRMIHLAAF